MAVRDLRPGACGLHGALSATLIGAVLTGLLAGCSPAPGKASATLEAAMRFGAYPHSSQIDEQISPDSFGPFGLPGRYGSRRYRTGDTPAAVRAYYQALGRKNGWEVTASKSSDQDLEAHVDLLEVQLSRPPIVLNIRDASGRDAAEGFSFTVETQVSP